MNRLIEANNHDLGNNDRNNNHDHGNNANHGFNDIHVMPFLLTIVIFICVN